LISAAKAGCVTATTIIPATDAANTRQYGFT